VSGGAIEIITGRERRRRWSIEEKLRIVAETDEPGARVTEVAARHGVYPGLLFTWRRQVRDGLLVAPPPATFVPVRMLPLEVAAEPEVRHAVPGPRDAPPSEPRRPEMIEITLVNGCRLLVDQHVEARALRRIVGVLRG
jgi:transposase